jgi:hypothetical protein
METSLFRGARNLIIAALVKRPIIRAKMLPKSNPKSLSSKFETNFNPKTEIQNPKRTSLEFSEFLNI